MVPLVCGVQAEPFHLRMIPPAPVHQILLSSVPQTLWRALVVWLNCGLQAVPFHTRIVPDAPTAQTLLRLVPQTVVSRAVVPLA